MRQLSVIIISIIVFIAISGCSGTLKIPTECISCTGLDAHSQAEKALIQSKLTGSFYYQIVADFKSPNEIRPKLTQAQLAVLPSRDIPLDQLSKKSFLTKEKSGIIRAWPSTTTEATGGVPVFAYSLETEGKTQCTTNTVAVRIIPPTLYSSPDIQINYSLNYQVDDTVALDSANRIVSKASQLYTAMEPMTGTAINEGMNEIQTLVLPYFRISRTTINDMILLWDQGATPTLKTYLPIIYEEGQEEKYLAGFIVFHVRVDSTLFNVNKNESTGVPIFEENTISIIPETITDKNGTRLTQKIEEYRQTLLKSGTEKADEVDKFEEDLSKNFGLSIYDIAFCIHITLSSDEDYGRTIQATLPGIFGTKYAAIARQCKIDVREKNELIDVYRDDTVNLINEANGNPEQLNEILKGFIRSRQFEYEKKIEFVNILYSTMCEINDFNEKIKFTYYDSTKDFTKELQEFGMRTKLELLEREGQQQIETFEPTLLYIEHFMSTMKLSHHRNDLLEDDYLSDKINISSYIPGVYIRKDTINNQPTEIASALSPLKITKFACIYDTKLSKKKHKTISTVGNLLNAEGFQGVCFALGVVEDNTVPIKILFTTEGVEKLKRITSLKILKAQELDITKIKQFDQDMKEASKNVLDEMLAILASHPDEAKSTQVSYSGIASGQ